MVKGQTLSTAVKPLVSCQEFCKRTLTRAPTGNSSETYWTVKRQEVEGSGYGKRKAVSRRGKEAERITGCTSSKHVMFTYKGVPMQPMMKYDHYVLIKTLKRNTVLQR